MRIANPTLLVAVLSLAIAVLSAPPCSAQARGTVEISPVFGAYFAHFPRNHGNGGCYPGHMVGAPPSCRSPYTETAIALGGRVTTWVRQRIAVEGSLWYSPSSSTDNLIAGNVRLQWRVYGVGGSWAYVAAGPAFVTHTAYPSGFGGVFGGGAHLRLGPSLALRAEFENYVTPHKYVTQWAPFLSLGLSVAFKDPEQKRGQAPVAPEP